MAIVYLLRIRWLFQFKKVGDRQAPTGLPNTTKLKGIIFSWAAIGMPWTMESTRTKIFFYSQFVLFHLGVVAAIFLSFLIPYAPSILKSSMMVIVFQVIIGAAFLIGCGRIIRRFSNKYVRAISSPDDYFSLILLTVWFGFAFLAVPNNYQQGETILLIYFYLTAFFLVYVPFSKISHYLYYPFSRFWFGRSMGHRGVYPLRHGGKERVEYGK